MLFDFFSRAALADLFTVGGKFEAQGPLAGAIDLLCRDTSLGTASWEEAESALQTAALAGLKARNLKRTPQLLVGGDLENQCTATTFGAASCGLPVLGLYGACSTFALGLLTAGMICAASQAQRVGVVASSHYCAAERQFRFPLEYGNQATPTSQHTVTGAAAALVTFAAGVGEEITLRRGYVGHVVDYGVKDPANMGAAMAPAAAETLNGFWTASSTAPEDYDLILTGDLGETGSRLLQQLLAEHKEFKRVHRDGGMLIFDAKKQRLQSGGSGCACSALVMGAYALPLMRQGLVRRMLLVGTGALMSPVTSMQGKAIPCVAHAIELERRDLLC
ncbi:MAG: stage V sporulation protein AD [Clostridia bacterium]|nr:stage V sporulation protein AD [Clostridia bacterium]